MAPRSSSKLAGSNWSNGRKADEWTPVLNEEKGRACPPTNEPSIAAKNGMSRGHFGAGIYGSRRHI